MKQLLFLLVFIFASTGALAQWGGGWDDFAPDYELDYMEDWDDGGWDDIRDGVNERVTTFDIAGVMLGMEINEVREAMRERRYALRDTEHSIPQFFQFNFDAKCRARNIFLPEAVRNCIESFGQSERVRYISRMRFERPDTDEIIDIHFTSPLTRNRVWRVDYRNNIDNMPGQGMHFYYQRQERRRAFWFYVIQKFGEPNVGNNLWVLDTNQEFSAQLQAFFGRLILENRQMHLADVIETQREARRTFQAGEFTF